MTGTCQYGYVVFRNVINLMEIIGYDQVFVGYDTLDGSNDEFILQLGFSAFGGDFSDTVKGADKNSGYPTLSLPC